MDASVCGTVPAQHTPAFDPRGIISPACCWRPAPWPATGHRPPATADTFYIAANGSDSNAGTTIANTQCITSAASIYFTSGAPAKFLDNHRLSLHAGKSLGYSTAETYAFAPVSATGRTVQHGANQQAACTEIAAIDPQAGMACQSDTTYAVGYDVSTHSVVIPGRAPVGRPLLPTSGGCIFPLLRLGAIGHAGQVREESQFMSQWQVGQVVVLKCGGATMTIARQSPHGTELWVCAWWSGGKRHERTFHAGMLRPAIAECQPVLTTA